MVKDSVFSDSICYFIYFCESISAVKADKGKSPGEKKKDITALKQCGCQNSYPYKNDLGG